MAIESLASTHDGENQQFSSKQYKWLGTIYNYPPLLRKVAAEVIATYLLVFVACGGGVLCSESVNKISTLAASIAGGLMVTVMIYAVGHISGAHMNPAVTIAFAAVKHFPWKQVPFYAMGQLTGAIGASFTIKVLLHPIKNVAVTSPSGTDLQALIAEIVFTFTLMFILSAVATDTRAVGELAGLATGSAVCIAAILSGPISGASMNPARTLASAIASSYYKSIWVYFIGPIVGALVGAWTYNLIRITDKPVQAINPGSSSFSLKNQRIRSNDGGN